MDLPSTDKDARKGAAYVSKRRWVGVCALLKDTYGDTPETARTLQQIADAIGFDPLAKTCTPQRVQQINEWRARKAAETGQSLYVVAGQQKYYQRKTGAVARSNAD